MIDSCRGMLGDMLTEREKTDLAALQANVVRGNLAMLKRNRMLKRLYDSGKTQPELASVLNAVARAEGDKEITPDAVYRAIKRVNDRSNK
jgi:hypothetical protein